MRVCRGPTQYRQGIGLRVGFAEDAESGADYYAAQHTRNQLIRRTSEFSLQDCPVLAVPQSPLEPPYLNASV